MNKTFFILFAYIAEAIILWQYTSGLFTARSRYPRRLRIIALILSHALLYAVFLLENTWLNVALFCITAFLFMTIFFNLKWYLSLFHAALLTVLMVITELVSYHILNYFSIDFYSKTDNPSNVIIFVFFSKIVFFFSTYILMNFIKQKSKTPDKGNITSLVLSLVPIMSSAIITLFLVINENTNLPASLGRMVSTSALFLLAINLLVFGMHQYTQKKDLEFTQVQLSLQKESSFSEYYKMLLAQKENQNILIHDIKKHLQALSLLNAGKEYAKIDSYIKQLLQSSDLTETARFCDHDLLNAVLYHYQHECKEKKILFYTDIRSKTTTFLADYDVTSLFSNLLENAVEAAGKVSGSYIELSVTRRENAPFVVLTLINSCEADPFSRFDGRLISRKPDPGRHGFGIRSIRKVVERYNGDMRMYYDAEAAVFHTVLTLYMIH